jgi:NAD(P)-dependent dehydrogenase (short-subunit alcohol dehydrogenase family)
MGWVLVTGATGGIARALIAKLSKGGFDVIAAARKPGQVPSGSQAKSRIVPVALDLTDQASIGACATETARITGDDGLTGLVNMAGIIVEGPLEALMPKDLALQFEVNAIGPFALTKALLPLLKSARGRIVNVGAISAHLTVPFYGPVAASKAALASLNDAMRLEFAQYGIGVFLVEPGAMATSIFEASRKRRDAGLLAQPELERQYRPALQAMDKAFERAGADKPQVAAAAILHALTRKRAKPRAVVGKGTGGLLLLSRLPVRMRDRLVKGALGLSRALRPLPV